MSEPQIIVDHLSGSRRGERQTFAVGCTVRFGRHPDSEVRFHAHRDLDASSRHAELERDGDLYMLRDVGSSNGTFVDGELTAERAIAVGESLVVDFGDGGPRLRIYVGEPENIPLLQDVTGEYEPLATGVRLALVAVIAAIVATAVTVWIAFV